MVLHCLALFTEGRYLEYVLAYNYLLSAPPCPPDKNQGAYEE